MKYDPRHDVPPPSPEAPERGHETADVKTRAMPWLLAAGLLTGILIWAGVWFFMQSLLGRDRLADRPRSAVVAPRPRPAPPLQPSVGHDSTPALDVEMMREGEDAVFAKLGWAVETGTHKVAIPDAIVRQLANRARGPATRTAQ